MNILALGTSVPTPPGGVTAEVVVVRSFSELEELGEDNVSSSYHSVQYHTVVPFFTLSFLPAPLWQI